ncbi:MAG: WYL domain-containing protein [Flavobacteriales bacterium]|nr:WYL domain-containing protein [Flavobacteriales bacterium]
MTQLRSKRLITAREIAEEHGISIRTVYRDIRTLERSGFPIVTEEGRGYSIIDGYVLPPIMFTRAEANALITAELLVNEDSDASLVKSHKNAITKVKSTLKSIQQESTEMLSQRIQIRSYETKNQSSVLVEVQMTIADYQRIEIHYTNNASKTSIRKVEPFALYRTKSNWVLIAFCHLTNEFRAFRLDRINQLTLLDEYFEPHPMSLQEYFENCAKEFSTPDTPLSQSDHNFESINDFKIMKKVKTNGFKFIGVSIRTSNTEENVLEKIGGLWQRFFAEDIKNRIPNKLSEEILCMYTDYEGDHMAPYTMLLGCKVTSIDSIPEGMRCIEVPDQYCAQISTKGDLNKGLLYDAWLNIWKSNIDRKYAVDYEIYGAKASDRANAEVDIFVSLNS